jgi:3-oxoacyl-[acyl-carrier-protein] synthase II
MVSIRRRVVVTGMGMVTPVGKDLETTWAALLKGRGGVGPITLFDASTFATRIAAEVKGFALADYRTDAQRWRDHGRATQFALAAATKAMENAGLTGSHGMDPRRIGVYLGSGEGEQDFPNFVELVNRSTSGGEVDKALFTGLGRGILHQAREAEQEPGTPASYLAGAFGARGYNATCLTACAASAQAIGEGVEVIRRGAADVMLTGGSHSMIHPFGVTGFVLLTAMSNRNEEPERASRPFDRDRDGFLLGEGCGMLVLEELEHAKARGAMIHGEVVGQCSTADAFRLTDSHDQGRGAVAAMQGALVDARLDPEDVDYINAHGTSTKSNDSVETLAIKRTFGSHGYGIPISSTKSMTGHMVAAGGAVEAIICLLAIRDGIVPPTINYETPDPACDLDYVPNFAREEPIEIALSNSFGFGGQNTALMIRRFAG